ncbi:NADH-quinone oxidoreductase subunit A [Mucilaginibacter sp. Bleaf8]|uniref:NADH-quinone oxidoreductase subunit A n=1 Tax=Mucilaginibacter sp. Bleaf8 TaxID=2834430 RepID=UPI001BCFF2CE|nr:NADH-quinone oxidoreductase subunit A [Mucilaginibacter sp. Bleaf8]MBS7563411.1 NADH-quinone oxidoreductase subunit A [Mucilaginibacter sp. Bleaf8]
MNEVSQISEFGKIFIFLVAGFLLVGLTLFLNKILAPNKPNYEKLTSYECGEEPVGSAWMPFNTRFYIIALIFLLFDVEMVFIFPWATVYADSKLIATDSRWGVFTLIEMFVFAGILILGLVYVWCKGDLEYIKPKQVLPTVDVKVPLSLYDKLNLEQSNYTVKTFAAEHKAAPEPAIPVTDTTAPATAKKPMFKPSFKKPNP